MTIQVIFTGAEKMVFDTIENLSTEQDAFGTFTIRFTNKEGNSVTIRGATAYALTRFTA